MDEFGADIDLPKKFFYEKVLFSTQFDAEAAESIFKVI